MTLFACYDCGNVKSTNSTFHIVSKDVPGNTDAEMEPGCQCGSNHFVRVGRVDEAQEVSIDISARGFDQ